MAPETQEHDFGGSAEARIERLIFYATRHGMLFTQMGESLQDVRSRLHALEEDRMLRRETAARDEERDLALQADLKALKEAVNGFKGIINKIVALVFSGIGVAFLAWVLKGGLS